MNDIHSFKCTEDQTLAEILEFAADLKIIDIKVKTFKIIDIKVKTITNLR